MTFGQIYNYNISLGNSHNSAINSAYQQMSATYGPVAAEQAMYAFLGGELGTGTTPGAPSGTTPGAPSGTTGGIAGLPGEDYTPDPPLYISTPFGDFEVPDSVSGEVPLHPVITEWLSSEGSSENPATYSFPVVNQPGPSGNAFADFLTSGAGAGGDMGTSPVSGLGSFNPGTIWAQEQMEIADWRAGIGHHPLSPDLTQHLDPIAFGQYVDQHYGGFVDWQTFSSDEIGDQGRYGDYLDYIVSNKPHAMEPYLWYLAAWDAVNLDDIENIREASNRLYSDPDSAFFGLTLEGNIAEWWPYFQGMQPLGIRILEPESSTSGYGYEITSDVTAAATPPVTTPPDVTTPTDVITTPPDVTTPVVEVDPLPVMEEEITRGRSPEADAEAAQRRAEADARGRPSRSERRHDRERGRPSDYEPPDRERGRPSDYEPPDTSEYDPEWTTDESLPFGESFQSGGTVPRDSGAAREAASKSFYVGPSEIHGNGAFAQEPIRKGDVVDYLVQGLYAGGLAGGNRTRLGDFINHRSNPNGSMKQVPSKPEHFYLEAMSDIEPGAELTMNYYDTPDWVAKPNQVDPENYESWG